MNEYDTQAQFERLCLDWHSFEQQPFPTGWAGREVHGICLVQFNAAVAELLLAFVRRRVLRPNGRAALRHYLSQFDRIIPELDPPASRYFEDQRQLVGACLRIFKLDCAG